MIADQLSWRWIFAVNIPFVIVTLFLIAAAVDERPRSAERPPIDWAGAALCALGLAGPVFALVRQPDFGWGSPEVLVPFIAGLAIFLASRAGAFTVGAVITCDGGLVVS